MVTRSPIFAISYLCYRSGELSVETSDSTFIFGITDHFVHYHFVQLSTVEGKCLMNVSKPTLIASDLEGVFLPEIWIAVAQRTGIVQLSLTTRDISDYDELMRMRLGILAEHKLTLKDIHTVIGALDPLPGAAAMIRWIQERTRLIILTDSYYEFVAPLLGKLGYPTIFAHSLQTDESGALVGYELRTPHSKRRAVRAFSDLGFRTMAFGDSYNDTAMLAEADQGVLFSPPANVAAEFAQYPAVYDYTKLRELIEQFLQTSSRE
jgi:phosphoserine / homoserine phosphotransferase